MHKKLLRLPVCPDTKRRMLYGVQRVSVIYPISSTSLVTKVLRVYNSKFEKDLQNLSLIKIILMIYHNFFVCDAYIPDA